MRRGRGFTLLEVMTVMAIISLLVSVFVPAVRSVKQRARLVLCRSALKSLGTGIWLYTADHQSLFPPFAFSNASQPDLLLSGHWGGSQNPNDPDLLGRFPDEMAHVNLTALSYKQYVPAKGLICPGAEAVLRDGEASYFAYSDQFSTYCLRFPHSEDLYRETRQLRDSGIGGSDVLGIYRIAAGGCGVYVPCRFGVGRLRQIVPYVHSEWTYRTGREVYDPGRSALLADAFWMRDYRSAAPEPGAGPVIRRRYHEKRYNVLFGHGGVATVTDDGTIESTAVGPGETPTGRAPYYEQAETLWAFFDSHN